MNKKLTAKNGKWHLVLWPLMVLGSVLLIIWSPNGLLHLRQLHLEHQELIQKNHTLDSGSRPLRRPGRNDRSDKQRIDGTAH